MWHCAQILTCFILYFIVPQEMCSILSLLKIIYCTVDTVSNWLMYVSGSKKKRLKMLNNQNGSQC